MVWTIWSIFFSWSIYVLYLLRKNCVSKKEFLHYSNFIKNLFLSSLMMFWSKADSHWSISLFFFKDHFYLSENTFYNRRLKTLSFYIHFYWKNYLSVQHKNNIYAPRFLLLKVQFVCCLVVSEKLAILIQFLHRRKICLKNVRKIAELFISLIPNFWLLYFYSLNLIELQYHVS